MTSERFDHRFAPEATYGGTRWFVARDPDANLIAFEARPSP
jgi:hypothetical protein